MIGFVKIVDNFVDNYVDNIEKAYAIYCNLRTGIYICKQALLAPE